MIVIPFALLVLFGPLQQQNTPADLTSQQSLEQAKAKYEVSRQAAIQVNDLAGNIHSEAEARAFVDAVATRLFQHSFQYWNTLNIRRRVAHVEYAAVSNPSDLIPEQRIVDVWNEYVREINAPEEALATVAEVHNMRDGMYFFEERLWKGQSQSLWTMPNVQAVDATGKLASGCRAVEALKILYHMHELFQNLLSARERVQKGILISEVAEQRQEQNTASMGRTTSVLRAVASQNPVRLAAARYLQENGEAAYQRLLKRLFDELFPTE